MKSIKGIVIFFFFTILSGFTVEGTASNGGFFKTFFVQPFSLAIEGIASLFNDNYGIAIIIITILIRLILLPIMLKQQIQQKVMKEKMDALKPKMDELQKKMKKAKDSQEQQKVQMEMMQFYREQGINPLSVGCLPLLIQMPILMGLYYAISHSKEIAQHSFLWFDLGSPDIALALISSGIYFLQMQLSLRNVPKEQQGTMRMMGLLSPVMIGLFSLNAPAALPLYWTVGGMFLITQTMFTQHFFHVKKQKERIEQ
ncbi:membrane protein insertase YidC [Aeribacillus alveayuensis]|uniref:Membrane protein insertase YidC n=1 Tax=Aeribacillus alveayuensis TaxID=279215 RepID=A0ABT9VPK0_9BACI|nr:YidC/Oxa1 family membrane protein insertase [Bacillus alveayuensis]